MKLTGGWRWIIFGSTAFSGFPASAGLFCFLSFVSCWNFLRVTGNVGLHHPHTDVGQREREREMNEWMDERNQDNAGHFVSFFRSFPLAAANCRSISSSSKNRKRILRRINGKVSSISTASNQIFSQESFKKNLQRILPSPL